jgi:hypothetical protein
MRTHRFGRKIKLPSTIAIRHQIKKSMLEDAIKAEAAERTKAIPLQPEERHPVLSFRSSNDKTPGNADGLETQTGSGNEKCGI